MKFTSAFYGMLLGAFAMYGLWTAVDIFASAVKVIYLASPKVLWTSVMVLFIIIGAIVGGIVGWCENESHN